jgi:hypothetical protein
VKILNCIGLKNEWGEDGRECMWFVVWNVLGFCMELLEKIVDTSEWWYLFDIEVGVWF